MNTQIKQYKTTIEYRNKVKNYYENKIRQDPERYKQKLQYHKDYYNKLKDALKQIKEKN